MHDVAVKCSHIFGAYSFPVGLAVPGMKQVLHRLDFAKRECWLWREVGGRKSTCKKFIVRGHGDHRRIVSTILKGGNVDIPSQLAGPVGEHAPESAVSGDAASDGDLPDTRLPRSKFKFVEQHADKVLLKARTNI